ncbi:hypothetical protein PM082_012216 [Marasmius tenuissimus]|nr:hypothetical protein PM082_012216 [Marasmius tenuissimus]
MNSNHHNNALTHQELYEVAKMEREGRLDPSKRFQNSTRLTISTASLTRRFSNVQIVPEISNHSRSTTYRRTADTHVDGGRVPSLRTQSSHTSRPYPSAGVISRSVSSSRVSSRRPGIPTFDAGPSSETAMGTVPIPGHSSGRTPVYFASQGRKAAPPTTAFGRSYPMRYIEPNLQSTAGPGSCNNDPQKCILHMTGTLSLCSPLRCPLQGEIPHENSQRFSHQPPANVIAAIPLSSTGLSLQRILNREIQLPPAIGPLEVDRRVVPGHEMRIMIAASSNVDDFSPHDTHLIHCLRSYLVFVPAASSISPFSVTMVG